MHELAARLKKDELEKHIGSSCSVLWEQRINQETGMWAGYTPHYHRIVSNDASIGEAKVTDISVDQVSQDGLSLVNWVGRKPILTYF